MQLSEYLTDADMTASAFAAQLGVQRATVTRYLNKQRLPKPEIMLAIQDATDGAVAPADWYPEPTTEAA